VLLSDELWAASRKAGLLCSGGALLDVRPLAGGHQCVAAADAGAIAGLNATGKSALLPV
jgi:hypothetical protein